jgi:hypothetical protein
MNGSCNFPVLVISRQLEVEGFRVTPLVRIAA